MKFHGGDLKGCQKKNPATLGNSFPQKLTYIHKIPKQQKNFNEIV